MVDLFHAISTGGYQPSDPYPHGKYTCIHDFPSPVRYQSSTAVLELDRIPTPNWQMTFEDLGHDVEAFWYAALSFIDPVYGLPMMDVTVNRYVNGESGGTFLAERGVFRWELYATANVSTS